MLDHINDGCKNPSRLSVPSIACESTAIGGISHLENLCGVPSLDDRTPMYETVVRYVT